MEQSYENERELLERYKKGLTTPQENLLIEHSFNNFAESAPGSHSEADEKAIGKKIWSRLPLSGLQPIAAKKLWARKSAMVAASVVVLLGIGFFYYQSAISVRRATVASQYDIEPGGNRATLTLADGRKILLDKSADGELAEENGVKVTKTDDGQIVYDITGAGGDTINSVSTNAPVYNTIEAPNGGQYQVRLPDGTAVWLNASSSLKFPTSFASQIERRVQLIGEAYFEVAKDKTRPFIVVSGDQEVEVLGTHFNIHAYDDESSTRTTLLEGSVKVSSLKSRISNLLKPGQQASLTAAGHMEVTEVDVEDVVAWKDGFFTFNNENMESIMSQISKWYAIEVYYEDSSAKEVRLYGSFSKFVDFATVVRTLERTKLITMEVTGNKVRISRRKQDKQE